MVTGLIKVVKNYLKIVNSRMQCHLFKNLKNTASSMALTIECYLIILVNQQIFNYIILTSMV